MNINKRKLKDKIYSESTKKLIDDMKGKSIIEWLKERVDIDDENSLVNSNEEFWNDIVMDVGVKRKGK